MEKLGEKIYSLRKEKGLSQEELAAALNVSRQSVSKWETDQSVPDYDNVAAMCAFFGVSLDGFTGNGAAAEGVMPVALGEAVAAAVPAVALSAESKAEDKRLWKKIFFNTFLWFFAAVGVFTFLSFLLMAIVVGKDDPQFKTMIIPMLCVSYTVLFAIVFTIVAVFHKKNKKPRD
ncbi:MAG: helix-turn-helix domain-containing protein [Clostridia bacterium]|nr:helix-turn-helix domain-containing protein [Clostridia bacterium]